MNFDGRQMRRLQLRTYFQASLLYHPKHTSAQSLLLSFLRETAWRYNVPSRSCYVRNVVKKLQQKWVKMITLSRMGAEHLKEKWDLEEVNYA